jgi:hypothetical protein
MRLLVATGSVRTRGAARRATCRTFAAIATPARRQTAGTAGLTIITASQVRTSTTDLVHITEWKPGRNGGLPYRSVYVPQDLTWPDIAPDRICKDLCKCNKRSEPKD